MKQDNILQAQSLASYRFRAISREAARKALVLALARPLADTLSCAHYAREEDSTMLTKLPKTRPARFTKTRAHIDRDGNARARSARNARHASHGAEIETFVPADRGSETLRAEWREKLRDALRRERQIERDKETRRVERARAIMSPSARRWVDNLVEQIRAHDLSIATKRRRIHPMPTDLEFDNLPPRLQAWAKQFRAAYRAIIER